MKRTLIFSILTICFTLGLTVFPSAREANAAEQTVLATTFPIYQIVRNVTQGRDEIKVDLMLPGQLGCPHDYALTPQDMQQLAKADILVVNGLGMEEFLGAPLKKTNPNLRLIDSATGIQETLQYSGDQHHEHDHDHEDAEVGPQTDEHGHGSAADGHHEHGHAHHHGGVNPHLFASPRMTAKLALNIAVELSEDDPNGAATYFKNAQVYAEAMNKLADDMAALGKRLKNKHIVQPHGVFDYLARDVGLEIVAVMQAHGHEPSAAEMLNLVKTMKAKQAGAIFTEPQYPEKIGTALSKETGVPVVMLDPVATGPENAPLSYYETVMRQNMTTLELTLGVK